jgi:agmatinase
MPMDEGKLARLREIAERGAYAGLEAPVRDFMDEAFGSDIPPLYSGVRTLLSAPLQQDLGALDVALVGVPFDLGVVNRPGARFGPRAVREISSVGPYHHHTRVLPAMLCRIGDVGDVELQRRHSLDEGIEEIERYFHRLVDAGVTPLSVGGDHSITYPILKALGRDEPVGCVHIDAHCDTGPEWGGSKFHHGGPFRNAALAGALDPERTIQIGIRGTAEMVWDFSYESGMTVIHVEEFHDMGLRAVIEKTREVVGGGPVYVSFDVDGLDPVYAPGTGTPEVGGLTPIEAKAIVQGLRGLDVIGGDVVEVAPEYDPTSNTALAATTMLFEILCVVAEGHAARRSNADGAKAHG